MAWPRPQRLTAPPAELIGWFELGTETDADLKAYAALGQRLGIPIGLELILPCQKPVAEELAEAAALLRQAGLTPAEHHPDPGADDQMGSENAGGDGPARLRRSLCGGASGLSGHRHRRRGAEQFHRAQYRPAEPGGCGLRHPWHLRRDPRARRPQRHGDPGDPAPYLPLGARHRRKASLSPRPQRHGHALQPLWQDDRRQSRQYPHRLRPSGPAPARPVRRRLRARLYRPGRRRPASSVSASARRPGPSASSIARPITRSPGSMRRNLPGPRPHRSIPSIIR